MERYYQRYCETLLAVGDNVGELLKWLDDSGEADNTLVIHLGDNGFLFGEHGLIDKRNAYEDSIPLQGDRGTQLIHRCIKGSKATGFSPEFCQ